MEDIIVKESLLDIIDAVVGLLENYMFKTSPAEKPIIMEMVKELRNHHKAIRND